MRKIVMGSLVAVLSLTSGHVALAHSNQEESEERPGLLGVVNRTVEKTLNIVEDATDLPETEKATEALKSNFVSLREQVDARKSELRNEIKQKQEDRKEKLEGRRLAQCQNRQSNINLLIDKSVEISRNRLARIQRIEDGVKTFYKKQELASTSYDAAVQTVEQKEAAVIAILDVTAAQGFECGDVDGTNPSGIIKTTHETKRKALGEYKDAVKNLIKVVKAAFAEKKATSEVAQ